MQSVNEFDNGIARKAIREYGRRFPIRRQGHIPKNFVWLLIPLSKIQSIIHSHEVQVQYEKNVVDSMLDEPCNQYQDM